MSTLNGNAGGVGGPVVGTTYVAELGRVIYASSTDDDAIARFELPKCLSRPSEHVSDEHAMVITVGVTSLIVNPET